MAKQRGMARPWGMQNVGVLPDPWAIKESMKAMGLRSRHGTRRLVSPRPRVPKPITSETMPMRMHIGMMPNPWMVARGVKAAQQIAKAQHAAAPPVPPTTMSNVRTWRPPHDAYGKFAPRSKYSPNKHPKYPKGTPGGKGGQFMRTLNGVRSR